MDIRFVTINDLDYITIIEKKCFPEAEAATKKSFKERILRYPEHFRLLENAGGIIGFINGMVTNKKTISDEMFENAKLHDENGKWQAIFGLAVLQEYRKNGYGAMLMEKLVSDAKEQKRMGCILTCKDKLIHYYAEFGFKYCGLSESVHGGAAWYDMRLEF